MSYQVLARKWRPGKFSELVGQEHVVSAISNALDNDRLHHAYLFTGTRGVGKTTIARIFSKSLNCEQGQGANPCGQCDTCKEIEHGNYVDLLEIDAASRTKVEDTRELLDNVQYKPTRGRFKVYLIDEVHMLSKHSFNALLKTLEEPPPHVKFLLATTDPQKLPITILSRCLQFNLKALSREQITGQLAHILDAEAVAYEAPALSLLARAAQGSMRDALSLTDQAIAQGDNQVLAAIVTDMLGLMDKHQLLRLIHAVVKKEPQSAMDIIAAMAEQAPDYAQVISELSSLLHQIALTQWIPDVCKLETTSAKAIYQLAKSLPAEQVQLLYQIALQGQKDLPYAPDGRSGLEMTVLRMMSFAPSGPVEGLDDILSAAPDDAQPLPVHSTTPGNTSGSTKPEAGSELKQPQSPSPVEQQAANLASPASASTAPAETTGAHQNNVASPQHHNQQTVPDESASTPPQSTPAADEHSEERADEDGDPALAQELAALESHAEQLRDDTAKRQSPAQYNEHQQDDSGPPPFEDGPPLSAYEDMPMEDQEASYDEPASEHNVHDSSAAAPQQSAEHQLSSTEEMLALRQRLKKAREESRQSGVKKPETSAPVRLPTRQMPAGSSSDNAQTDMPEPAASRHSVETASSPAPVDNDPPPWATETRAEHTAAPASETHIDEESQQTPSQHGEAQPEIVAQESAYEEADASDAKPQPVTESYNGAPLSAYLEDGSKLVHASQIDSWSQLVENMPIAGLLKQIALHAAFHREDDNITLELDESQAHLVNESAIAQLTSALNEGLGREISLEIKMGQPESTPFQIQQRIQNMRQQHAEHVVSTDDKIQSLMSVFQASVVADSVKAR
ncbi:DNA polymerase III subunit gamma/tau [Alteromonas sp. H39]|uniref:DNA polymerase III subunit gamma/tau n=1 Tax=Alteromonas sp. H39 TaxID=3389876 RepID=UPI0039DFC3E2